MNDLASILDSSPLAHLLDTIGEQDPKRAREDLEARKRREAADRRETRRQCLLARHVPALAAAIIASEQIAETEAVQTVRAFMAQRRRRLLVIDGAPDASKTTAASVAVDMEITAWCVSTVDTRTEPAPMLIPAELLVGAWMYYDRSPSRDAPRDPLSGATKQIMCACRLLVLDDIGQEGPEHIALVGEILDTLVRLRCDAGLRTIITTNLAGYSALVARYPARAQRIGERLTEHGVWKHVEQTGMRRNRGAEVTT